MRAFISLVCAVFLSSCGQAPDPAFAMHNGDLAGFLESAALNRVPRGETSRIPARVECSWHSRTLTSENKSGEYLGDRQALQVATSSTNFASLSSFLTQRLGDPTVPARDQSERGWVLHDVGLSVRLRNVDDQCQVELVTTPTRAKP